MNKPRNRPPLITMEEFEFQHTERDLKLKKYMTTKRGRAMVDDVVAETLKRSACVSLKANSSQAHILFARSFARQVRKNLMEVAHLGFLTLTPKEFAIPIDKAHQFDVRILRDWTSQKLKTFHHISIMEPAYYSNWTCHPGGPRGVVHWHVHALVWSDREEHHPKELIDGLEESECEPFIPGLAMAKLRMLKPPQYEGRAIYMSKAVLNEYRIYPIKCTSVEKNTGHIYKQPTGRFRQRKRPLRPGDAVRLCRLMQDLSIMDLVFGNEDGKQIVEKAVKRALSKGEQCKMKRILNAISPQKKI